MQMWTNPRFRRNYVDQVVVNFGSLQTGQPQPPIARNLYESAYQVRQPAPIVAAAAPAPLQPVMTQVNTCQYHFMKPGMNKPAYFCFDDFRRPARQLWPH